MAHAKCIEAFWFRLASRSTLTMHHELIQVNPYHCFTVCTSHIRRSWDTCPLEDNGSDLFLRHLEAFIARSRCTLRRLSLTGTLAPHTVAEILRKCSSVNELSQLTIPNPNGSAMLAPQLSIGCRDGSYIDYALCLQILRSRWKSEGCALKSVALPGPTPDPSTQSGLDAFSQNGLDLLLLGGSAARNIIYSWTVSLYI
ncbi:hypothetical protein DFH09DRAFT_1499093 [Mycena vulgaris]|nr:hypothetical protein DFH09DRAFT_1499093 [Mycena vulgaris]